MKKSLIIAAAIAIVAIPIGGISVYWAFEASQQVPAFYRQAVARDTQLQTTARDQFVAEATALASNTHRPGRWQHVFTADQINAWLALELANHYPGMLAPEWRDPRIDIDEHEATIACRFESGSIATVMSLSFDVYLQEPNVVALRIRRARAGALPVPLTQVLDAISQAARELKLRLEWRKANGDPVALVTLPPARDSQATAIRLESIELRKGELFVAGVMARGGERLAEAVDTTGGPIQDGGEPVEPPLVGAAAKETRQE
ncbi:MAG: hypothetical protein AB7O59_12195 [Pirellulales bacterium]